MGDMLLDILIAVIDWTVSLAVVIALLVGLYFAGAGLLDLFWWAVALCTS